jgi:hypothetical protein
MLRLLLAAAFRALMAAIVGPAAPGTPNRC